MPPPPSPLDNDIIQQKCQDFVKSLGIPGFIVFAWQKPDKQFSDHGFSFHELS